MINCYLNIHLSLKCLADFLKYIGSKPTTGTVMAFTLHIFLWNLSIHPWFRTILWIRWRNQMWHMRYRYFTKLQYRHFNFYWSGYDDDVIIPIKYTHDIFHHVFSAIKDDPLSAFNNKAVQYRTNKLSWYFAVRNILYWTGLRCKSMELAHAESMLPIIMLHFNRHEC